MGRPFQGMWATLDEEEIHLPAGTGKFPYGESWQGEVVGQLGAGLASGFVPEAHATELAQVVAGCAWVGKDDGLSADKAGGAIHRVGVEAPELEVALGPDDEYSPAATQIGESWEVEVHTIQNVDGVGLRQERIQHSVVGEGGGGGPEVGGDSALKLQKRVELDGAAVPSDLGPGEEGQTEIDVGGIQGVDALVHLQVQRIFGV